MREYAHNRYLGIWLNDTLSWSHHIEQIPVYMKATRQISMIYRRFYLVCSSNTLLHLYLSYVRPLLEYATPVWDPHYAIHKEMLEKVQYFAHQTLEREIGVTHPPTPHGLHRFHKYRSLELSHRDLLVTKGWCLLLCHAFLLEGGVSPLRGFLQGFSLVIVHGELVGGKFGTCSCLGRCLGCLLCWLWCRKGRGFWRSWRGCGVLLLAFGGS